jgi:lipoprotein NlpI
MQMRSSAYWLLACLAVVALAGLPTVAAADDEDTCTKQSGDLAIAACSRAIDSGRYTGRSLAADYVKRGREYQARRDLDRALADFSEAIRLDPTFALAFNLRGLAYKIKGDFDRAIADDDEGIRLDPTIAAAFNNRGSAYSAKGDVDRAIADYNEAIRLDPKISSAFNSRGFAYFIKGDLERAIADHSEAIRLNPKYAFAFLNRGAAYRAEGDLDRAIADYSEVIRLNPEYNFVLLSRGVAYYYAGSLPKALADLNQASELNPKLGYTALWLDILNKRSNLPSRLQQAVAQIDMTHWPAPVIRLFLGQMTPAAVLAAADDPDPDTKNSHICEARFYSGELALLRDAKEEAAPLFKAAAESCPRTFIGDGAVAELKRLAQ